MFAMYCVYMYTFHSAHTCILYNSVKCVHYFNNQDNKDTYYIIITLFKFTAPFVNSPLNSYLYIHCILDFKYILLLLGFPTHTLMPQLRSLIKFQKQGLSVEYFIDINNHSLSSVCSYKIMEYSTFARELLALYW